MTWRALTDLLRSAATKWNRHDAPQLGAALAYYALLSMAPLLILAIAICELVFSKSTAERVILEELERFAGVSSAQTLRAVIENAHSLGTGVMASVIALIALLFGASGMFVQLQSSLNKIWDAPPTKSSVWREILRQRLFSFAMVLALGSLLLVSLLLSAGFAIVEKLFMNFVPLHFAILGETANFVVSSIAVAILFGLIFKFVPDVPIDWRDVAVGALVTALLFDIGKAVLGLYLGTAGVGSTYGAAGSLVALVVWVYYSAQIFFFGAIFTRVFADRLGSPSTKKQRAAVRESAASSAGQA